MEEKTDLIANAFNLERYQSDFIMDKRGIVSAKKYFVLKDSLGNRYGECSVLSLPFIHIDDDLNMYLAYRLVTLNTP